MLSKKLYLMQGDTLLATLYDGYSSEMFWLCYKYEAEDAFATIRPLFEKATSLIEVDPLQSDAIYRDLYYANVKLVDADSNEVFRHLLLHIDGDEVYSRPLFFAQKYIMKKDDTVLAYFVDCEDNADRMYWCVGQFQPTEAFNNYKKLFFEASELLQEHQNPERVQEIYAHFKSENIQLVEDTVFSSDEFATKHTNFTLRFVDDKVYICTFDNCD